MVRSSVCSLVDLQQLVCILSFHVTIYHSRSHVFLCLLSWARRTNNFLNEADHDLQLKVCVFSWVFSCDFKLSLRLNAAGQTLHLCGFSSLWVFSWFFRFALILKALGQEGQEKGFSSRCLIFSCVFKELPLLNCAVQVLQWYGFSPVCLLSWTFRDNACLNWAVHCWHLNGLSSVWIRWCVRRWELCVKADGHMLHW